MQHVAFAGLVNPNPGLRVLRLVQRRWKLDGGRFYTETDTLLDRVSQWVQFDSPSRPCAATPLRPAATPVLRAHALPDDARSGRRRCFRARAGSWALGLLPAGWTALTASPPRPPPLPRRRRLLHLRALDVLVVIADGIGDGLGSRCGGARRQADAAGAMPYPHSYGLFYATITGFLGFRPFRHEGKITGLALHGDPERVRSPSPSRACSPSAASPSPSARRCGSWLERLRPYSREDISARLQRGLEDELRAILSAWMTRTGLSHLSLAGRVFANVQLNQRIATCPAWTRSPCSPHGRRGWLPGPPCGGLGRRAPGGLGFYRLEHRLPGAGVLGRRDRGRPGRSPPTAGSRSRISRTPSPSGWPRGQIVCRFDGAMEYGPRALGNRTIMAPAHWPTPPTASTGP
ncbi:MAG: hypothetical protein H6741_33955 [Alphaproteobacteria bacterium]|nr:hypothetical protein [Alphaproteobacteria bacterium]